MSSISSKESIKEQDSKDIIAAPTTTTSIYEAADPARTAELKPVIEDLQPGGPLAILLASKPEAKRGPFIKALGIKIKKGEAGATLKEWSTEEKAAAKLKLDNLMKMVRLVSDKDKLKVDSSFGY